VKFLGFHHDPAHVYHGFDVFALSSRREGLPNALLEAMSTGLPVVATHVGGIEALVRHRRDGILVAPDSSRELAEAFANLRDDRALRSELGTAARTRILRGFTFQRRMQRMMRVYDGLIPGGVEALP
jgi:glycosyltransferase involved in cell wall biosynthesis